jgi:hypothetical protein
MGKKREKGRERGRERERERKSFFKLLPLCTQFAETGIPVELGYF